MNTNKDVYIMLDKSMNITGVEQEHISIEAPADFIEELMPQISNGSIWTGKLNTFKVRGSFNPLTGQSIPDGGKKYSGWSGKKLSSVGAYATYVDVTSRLNDKVIRVVLREELPAKSAFAVSAPVSDIE